MPKKVIDKREYWLDDDRQFRIIIENNYAHISLPHFVQAVEEKSSMSMDSLKKLWELLELVANDEWKPQSAKEGT